MVAVQTLSGKNKSAKMKDYNQGKYKAMLPAHGMKITRLATYAERKRMQREAYAEYAYNTINVLMSYHGFHSLPLRAYGEEVTLLHNPQRCELETPQCKSRELVMRLFMTLNPTVLMRALKVLRMKANNRLAQEGQVRKAKSMSCSILS
jgi:hypothetical protein